MALLVWCLGLATIYPPGSLIVTFEAHTFTESHNMSVMNPPIPQDLDFARNDSFPTLGDGGFSFGLPLYDTMNNKTSKIAPGRRLLTYR
jgi:hypothetical protein